MPPTASPRRAARSASAPSGSSRVHRLARPGPEPPRTEPARGWFIHGFQPRRRAAVAHESSYCRVRTSAGERAPEGAKREVRAASRSGADTANE